MPESTLTRQLSAQHDTNMVLLRQDLVPSIRTGMNRRDLPGGPAPDESLQDYQARTGLRVQSPINGLRTSLLFVRLPQENTRLGLDLEAVRSRLPALTHEGFPLFNNYLNATVAALRNLPAITRDALGANNASGISADAARPNTVSGSGGGLGHDAVLDPGRGGTHGVFIVVGTMPGDVPQAAVRFIGIQGYRARSYNAVALALKNAQLEMGRLVVENRGLRGKLTVFEQTNKKQQNTKGPDMHGYLGGIKTLGKKFGFMEEPWITVAVFTAAPANGSPPHVTPEAIEAMFKTPKLYLQYLTCAIYDHVPQKYHDLVDWTTFPNFGNNFVKYLNAGRSSVVNTLKANLPKILAECEITSNKGDLLYHPGEDRKGPPSAYPPIFYTAQKKNVQTRLLNPVLPMALRCMIFGPASIADKGNVKPLSTTLGYLWQLPTEGLTIGSICFTLTAIISVLSAVDTQFEEKGKISGIPFQTYFRGYKKLLMKTAETPGVRNILKVWTTAVFKKVAAAKLLDEPVIPDDEAEAAAEAEFAAAMEGMMLGEDPTVENPNPAFDWGQDDVDNASDPERQVEGRPQEIDQEEPEQELEEEEEPVPVVAVRRRGTGGARGGARAVVLDSDEDPAVTEPRRRGRRGAAVPVAIEEPPVQVQKKVPHQQTLGLRTLEHANMLYTPLNRGSSKEVAREANLKAHWVGIRGVIPILLGCYLDNGLMA
ncbi:hypothetical protein C8F04DRAFT_1310643 [Mycena alexandri]|uniref:Uncharacterized protein n=1 Tax=Mycena alexandri TaxID=1745969 RepID=A0AAD6WVF1_9AGAR|nr:hypothetical protein C8F04DRAFT_1310643 [Mycena alexandri]